MRCQQPPHLALGHMRDDQLHPPRLQGCAQRAKGARCRCIQAVDSPGAQAQPSPESQPRACQRPAWDSRKLMAWVHHPKAAWGSVLNDFCQKLVLIRAAGGWHGASSPEVQKDKARSSSDGSAPSGRQARCLALAQRLAAPAAASFRSPWVSTWVQ